MKNFIAATILLSIPVAASAATVQRMANIDLTQAGYSFSDTSNIGDDGVKFTFTFTERARISGISLSGSGLSNGDDIRSTTYTVINPSTGPEGFQTITAGFGTGAGASVIPGQSYAAGDVLTVLFEEDAVLPISYTVSFPVAAVPVPAAGLLLLTALGGAAAMRRRKKAATA